MMNEFLTEDTKAIILLCGVFGKTRSEEPLSLSEYSSLVRWLMENKMRPCDLLQEENIPEAAEGTVTPLKLRKSTICARLQYNEYFRRKLATTAACFFKASF